MSTYRVTPCLVSLALCLSGCATLPSSGPTANRIVRGAAESSAAYAFKVVDLDPEAALDLAQQGALGKTGFEPLQALKGAAPTDRIGPGDVLDISIYEVGVSLFSRTGPSQGGFDPAAHGEKFPAIVVDGNGVIRLPYVGALSVTGMTPAAVADAVDQRLRSKSQNPQAIVQVTSTMTNAVFISGDVGKAGKYDLPPGGARLFDLIALAGGVQGDPEDTVVTITRHGHTAVQRLGTIVAGATEDIALQAGDRIQLTRRPQSYTVFGAAGRVSQIDFQTSKITLAEAIARAAGPSDQTADPTAVFLFRQIPDPAEKSKDQRVIYRLDLTRPSSYFIAQNFEMRDKDLIYIANARSNQAIKFVAAVSQLFTPILTVRAVTK